VQGNTLKPPVAWALLILSLILITPTTLAYIPGSLYFFMAIPEAPVLALFIPLAGYGIYCSWCITLKMNQYTQYGAPPHIYMGIAAGTIALAILFKLFGLQNSIHKLIERPLSAIIMGFGPLISSCISLSITHYMRRNTANQSEHV